MLIDIRSSRTKGFSYQHMRVNLAYVPIFRVRLSLALRIFSGIIAVFIFIGGSVHAPTQYISTATAASVVDDQERQALEGQLKELEQQIDDYENQIVSYQKQGKTLKNEVGTLNTKIAQLNLRIRAINLTLTQLDGKITETQSKIKTTEETIASNKQAIQALIHDLYKSEQTSVVEIFLQKPRLSDFFNDLNGIELVRSNLQIALAQVTDLHSQLLDQKTQLSMSRADAAITKVYQDSQKKETEQVKATKNDLLEKTKGQESKYKVLLQQTKETAAQIRNRIFQLLGGGELSFEQAYDYAKIASNATGVRAALLLAVLDRESALGRNVGKCNYKTAMSPKERPVFLQITGSLGINPETVTVSCPNADGVYGGAMGPAQFIPSTWNKYKDEIAKATGHSVVSPWNNADAFVATSLYLRDAGAASASVSDERKAAARYYAGSRWQSYLWTYGQAVISRAEKFQDDIATITG